MQIKLAVIMPGKSLVAKGGISILGWAAVAPWLVTVIVTWVACIFKPTTSETIFCIYFA